MSLSSVVCAARKVVSFHENNSPWAVAANLCTVLQGTGAAPFVRGALDSLGQQAIKLVTSVPVCNDDSPLETALKGDDLEALETLLDLGADANARTPATCVPLFWAVDPFNKTSKDKVLALLKYKADVMLLHPHTQLRPLETLLRAVLPRANTPDFPLGCMDAFSAMIEANPLCVLPYSRMHDLTTPLHIVAAQSRGQHTETMLRMLAGAATNAAFNVVCKDHLVVPRTLARRNGYSKDLVRLIGPKCAGCADRATTHCACNGPYCFLARYCGNPECARADWKAWHSSVCPNKRAAQTS